MDTLTASSENPLKGSIRCPGDKSISHRALILGALALGTTRIDGLLNGSDVIATASALTQLGVPISPITENDTNQPQVTVSGVGPGGFNEPQKPLNLGNSGTGARLLMGAAAASPIKTVFTGDDSLSKRPMERIITPLKAMGATFTARDHDKLPITIKGTDQPICIDWESTVASAQVKSAILLAGLAARGTTRITEPLASRDHTERMLRHFGVEVTTSHHENGRYTAEITGETEPRATNITVPADPSSAAFPVIAALICPDSRIIVKNVNLNPLRFGLYQTLTEMGADIRIGKPRTQGGEPVADIECRSSRLKGITVPPERAASMIDEYPVLSVAAAFAEGVTHMPGIAELRVKETDRIDMMAGGLERAGVEVTTTADSMTVTGRGEVDGGIAVDANHDHRIAMSFLVLGLAAKRPVSVSGCATIATSFPGFADLMRSLGASIDGP